MTNKKVLQLLVTYHQAGSRQLHPAFDIIANNPPPGYTYLRVRIATMADKVKKYYIPHITDLVSFGRSHGNGSLPKADLIFTNCMHPITKYVPTVFHYEGFPSFTDFFPCPFRRVSESLISFKFAGKVMERYLKGNRNKIVVTSSTVAKSFHTFLPSGYEDRTISVPIGVPQKQISRRYNTETITILFVASSHPYWKTFNFIWRGGKEVLSVFKLLNNIYGTKIKLIIRAPIPQEVKRKYSKVLGEKNVIVHEQVLPRYELEKLYAVSDIFAFPAYSYSWLALQEAMSFGLPIVATDGWCIPDYVKDGINGLLAHRPFTNNFSSMWDSHPVLDYEKALTEDPHPNLINELCEKFCKLIDSSALRRKISKNNLREVRSGRFSLDRMRLKYEEIFNDVCR